MTEGRASTALFILILFAVTLLLFLPAMKGGFLWDDKYFVSENRLILGPHFLKEFLLTPFGGLPGMDEQSQSLGRMVPFYRPLLSFSYWLDYKIWGLNPAGFHLANILLHFLNALLLYLIFKNIGLKPLLSFFGSLLFVVFPLHFENVCWISGRGDLLSFFFASLSVLFFIKFTRQRRLLLSAASSLFYLCALLSKENVLLLIVVYLIFLYQKERKFKETAVFMLPYGLCLIIWLILRQAALGSPSYNPSHNTLLDFCATLGFYSFKTLFPFRLSYTIDVTSIFASARFQIFGGLLLFGFVVSGILLVMKRRHQALPLFMAFGYFLLLLPSTLVIFSGSAVSYLAWRFLYLPSAMFLLGLLLWLDQLFKKKAGIYALLGMLFLVYTAEIYPKPPAYGKTEEAFWLGLENFEREDVVARINVGLNYLPREEEKALRIFERILAEKEHPLHDVVETRIYEELASHFTFKKEFDRADRYFQKLFSSGEQQSQNLYFIYSYYLALKGQGEEGENVVRKMLGSFPENHLVLVHAARFYILIKNFEQAIDLLEKDYRLFGDKQSLALMNELKRLD